MTTSARPRSNAPSAWVWALRGALFVVLCGGHSVLLNFLQFLFLPLWLIDKQLFRRWCHQTEHYFAQTLILVTQLLAPTDVVFTHDDSLESVVQVRGGGAKQAAVLPSHLVELDLSPRAIVIANHQVYMDWIYLWFVAYYARCSGYVKIILKDSLRDIPIFGWGMQFFRFIFLKRNWAQDKQMFLTQISETAQAHSPFWLTLFPEGTTITAKTLAKSHEYAQTTELPLTRHVLLPRATGLYHVCQGLRQSADYVYDITMGLEGLTGDQFPQDVYTIPGMYLEGHYPRQVHIHVRRYPIADVPADLEKFQRWILQRWQEKDWLMAYFYRHGEFPHGGSVAQLCQQPPMDRVQPPNLLASSPQQVAVRLRSWTEMLPLWTIPLTPWLAGQALHCLFG
ncbi:hypothetical protein H4R35_002347 [Dimargaris xerosporica]|nr:hypothetical protein H4R35_002347 [Dimargaris xerosporica]